jgi:hypothetical protein
MKDFSGTDTSLPVSINTEMQRGRSLAQPLALPLTGQNPSLPYRSSFNKFETSDPLKEPEFFLKSINSLEQRISRFVETAIVSPLQGTLTVVINSIAGIENKYQDFRNNSAPGVDNAGNDPKKWLDKAGEPLLADENAIRQVSTGAWKTSGNGILNATPQEAVNNREAIINAVNDSPYGIAIVGGDDGSLLSNPSAADILPHNGSSFNGDKQFDHIAVAYRDFDGVVRIAELLTGDGYNAADDLAVGAVGKSPGSRWLDSNVIQPHPNGSFVASYDRVYAVPLRGIDQSKATKFLNIVKAETVAGSTYSFRSAVGQTCASVIVKAAEQSGFSLVQDKTADAIAKNIPFVGKYIHIVRPSSVIDGAEQLNASQSRAKVNSTLVSDSTIQSDGFGVGNFQQASTDSRIFYQITFFTSDFSVPNIRRGVTTELGDVVAALPADAAGVFEIYDANTRSYGNSTFLAADDSGFSLEPNIGNAALAPDTDRDGIPDIGEKIIGTSPTSADTDGDEIPDDLEIYDATLDSLNKTSLIKPFSVISFEIEPKQHYVTNLDTGRVRLINATRSPMSETLSLIDFNANITPLKPLAGTTEQGKFVLIHDANQNGSVELDEVLSDSTDSAKQALSPGRYYVLTYSTNDSLDYALSLTTDLGGDVITNAYDIGTLFGTQTFKDYIGTNDAADYYRFSTNYPGLLKLSLSDPNIQVQLIQDSNRNGVVDPNETPQSSTRGVASSEEMIQSLPAGSYIVRVLPGNEKFSDNYTISFTLDQSGNSLQTARSIEFLKPTQYIYDNIGEGDIDDYKFTITTPSYFSLLLDGLTADANVQLIQDLNGNNLADANEILRASGSLNKSPEAFSQPLTAGTYYVRVIPGASGNTNYSLSLSSTGVSSTDDSLATARSIVLSPEASYLTEWVGSTDNRDFYQFVLPTASSVDILMDNLSANATLQIIQDRNGNGLVDSNEILKTSNEAGLEAESIQLSLATSTYFIQVLQSSGDTHYSLRMTASSIPDLASNTIIDARTVNLKPTVTTFSDWVGTADLNDYYRFEAIVDSRLSLSLNSLKSDIEVQLIQDRNNNGVVESDEVLQISTNATAAKILSRDLVAGMYFIHVLPKNSDDVPYKLNVSLEQAGNTLATAQTIPIGATSSSLGGWVSNADPNDYYTFTLNRPGNIALRLSGLSEDINIKLLDSAGNLIEASERLGTTNEAITRQIPVGSYRVLVYATGKDSDYQLQTSVTPLDFAGNSLTTATDLRVFSGSQSMSDFIGDVDLEDYRRFNLDTSGTVTIELTRLSSAVNLQLIQDLNNDGVVTSNEIIQASSNRTVSSQSITQFVAAGTYFIRVTPLSSGINSEYSLNLTIDQAGNTLSTARKINLNSASQSFRDFLSRGFGADIEDIYQFSLATNQTLDLALSGESQSVKAHLVQDLNGNGVIDSNEVIAEFKANNLLKPTTFSKSLDAGTYGLRILSDMGLTNYTMTLSTTPIDWLGLNLQDLDLINFVRQATADGQFDRAEAIAMLRSTEDGEVVDIDELRNLREIFKNGNLLGMSAAVQSLGSKVISFPSISGNRWYQGAQIGSLVGNYSVTQMEQLIGKWFLGQDRPIAKSADNSSTYSYRYVSGSLFKNDIQYQDIRQGNVGNCYLLAALAATALRSPETIREMFTDNGDGTFTVRFYNNGVADYVTVDRYIPTQLLGAFPFADTASFYNDSQNELWVLLAEKAYAQLNELGWTGQDGTNSYQGISAGTDRSTLQQITGRAVSPPFTTYSTDAMLKALNAGQLVCLDSKVSGTVANIVPNHVYTVVGYDEINKKTTLFNPFGIGNHLIDGSNRPGIIQLTDQEISENFYWMNFTLS